MNAYKLISNLTPILNNLHTLSPCIIGSGILTRDGLVLESILVKEHDEDMVGAIGAALLASARQAALRVLQGSAGVTLVKSDNGFIIVAPCTGDLVLAVILTLDSALNEMIHIVECTVQAIDQLGFKLAA